MKYGPHEILMAMLSAEFPGVDEYREQLKVAKLSRHVTGCRIAVDTDASPAAQFEPDHPSAKLPVEAFGHGKLSLLLHAHAGYLDDLELINASEFPDPRTVKVRVD